MDGLTSEQAEELIQAARVIRNALKSYPRYEDEFNAAAGAGTNTKDFKVNARGKTLVLTRICAADDTSSPTRVRLGYWNRSDYVWIKTVPAPIATESVNFDGELILTEGMWPAVRWEGATSGDDLYASLSGYWIKD